MHFPFALPFGSIDDDLCAVSITVRVCGALCTTFSGRTPSPLVVRLPLQHVNVLVPDSSCQRLHILLFFFPSPDDFRISFAWFAYTNVSYLVSPIHTRNIDDGVFAVGINRMARRKWDVSVFARLPECRSRLRGWKTQTRYMRLQFISNFICFSFFIRPSLSS